MAISLCFSSKEPVLLEKAYLTILQKEVGNVSNNNVVVQLLEEVDTWKVVECLLTNIIYSCFHGDLALDVICLPIIKCVVKAFATLLGVFCCLYGILLKTSLFYSTEISFCRHTQ